MSTATEATAIQAELIKADTALKSFRDGGYHLADAVGEIVDNSIQAGAQRVCIGWEVEDVKEGKKKKPRRKISAFAIGDDGSGIAPYILTNVLTVGFSTRYGDRIGIGRYGVGFKLASISQVRRLEIYTRPAYLTAHEESTEDGSTWVMDDENVDGKVFMTYLDLNEIDRGDQSYYCVSEVDDFPEEFAHMVPDGEPGTVIVWRDADRLNHEQSYAETVDEKLHTIRDFLRRAYRVHIDKGLEIFLQNDEQPLAPYDPLFKLENPDAVDVGIDGEGRPADMTGELVDNGEIRIGDEVVEWEVRLTPKITRLKEGGGGVEGPQGQHQFKRLRIRDNEGRISFLRCGREISYAQVPRMLPGGRDKIDRYMGIQVSFPPTLDEYFQVKHIKRGAEPVEKLRAELRKALSKPVDTARKRIRSLWAESRRNDPQQPTNGGRTTAEDVAAKQETGLPKGRAGQKVTPQEQDNQLRRAAETAGITQTDQQDEWIDRAKQNPVVSVESQWPGKGLLDIEHLMNTVVVHINRRHPLINSVYVPIRNALENRDDLSLDESVGLLEKAADTIDLLLFAYAKAENMSRDPEEEYGGLRDDWGKFAAVYVRGRESLDDVKVDVR